MTISDMYQQLSNRISVLSADEISIQRLKAIVSRLNNLSKAHGSDEVRQDIEKIVKKFELCSDYLSAIESYLNTIDAMIRDSLSGASSRQSIGNNGNERRYTKMNKKFTVLQIVFTILTIVVSLAAIVFLVLGLIEEINYDMLAFYITLGGAVVSLVGLIISLKKGRSSESGKGRGKVKTQGSLVRNEETVTTIDVEGADLEMKNSDTDNKNCKFNIRVR